MSPRDPPPRDPRLLAALAHAPDQDLVPPAALSAAISAAARAAVAEPEPVLAAATRAKPAPAAWRRAWAALRQAVWPGAVGPGPAWAGGLAAAAVAGLTISLWVGEPVPPAVVSEAPPAGPVRELEPPTPARTAPAAADAAAGSQVAIPRPPAAPPVASPEAPPAEQPAARAAAKKAAKEAASAAAPAAAPVAEPLRRQQAGRADADAGTAAAPVPAPAAVPPPPVLADAFPAAPRDQLRGEAKARASQREAGAELSSAPAAAPAPAAVPAPAPSPAAAAAAPPLPRAAPAAPISAAPMPAAPMPAARAPSPATGHPSSPSWPPSLDAVLNTYASQTQALGAAAAPSRPAGEREALQALLQATVGRWQKDEGPGASPSGPVQRRWSLPGGGSVALSFEADGLRWVEPDGTQWKARLEPAVLARLRPLF